MIALEILDVDSLFFVSGHIFRVWFKTSSSTVICFNLEGNLVAINLVILQCAIFSKFYEFIMLVGLQGGLISLIRLCLYRLAFGV